MFGFYKLFFVVIKFFLTQPNREKKTCQIVSFFFIIFLLFCYLENKNLNQKKNKSWFLSYQIWILSKIVEKRFYNNTVKLTHRVCYLNVYGTYALCILIKIIK